MTSREIRQSFLDFFKSKQHTIVPSSSLLPGSPNLLFTNAGMNQFVPIFLGQRKPDVDKWPGAIVGADTVGTRAADTQKCIRAGGKHNDLDDVGLDTYHHTFFEMLGNWSFGDYFKKEAIEWGWELLTRVWKFPANRLFATVYKPGAGHPSEFDQEAYGHWERLFEAGANAKSSSYETDISRRIFDALEKLSGKKSGSTLPPADLSTINPQQSTDVAFRVIADHIRTLSFAIADGIQPSNEGRGYVLRRILRRAVRYGRTLGFHEPFFYKLVDVLAQTMGEVFPEIRKKKKHVQQVIRAEEEAFNKTLDTGIKRFNDICAAAIASSLNPEGTDYVKAI